MFDIAEVPTQGFASILDLFGLATEVPTQGFETIRDFDAAVRAEPSVWAKVRDHRRLRRLQRRSVVPSFQVRDHESDDHREALASIRLQEQSASPWSLIHSEDASPQ